MFDSICVYKCLYVGVYICQFIYMLIYGMWLCLYLCPKWSEYVICIRCNLNILEDMKMYIKVWKKNQRETVLTRCPIDYCIHYFRWITHCVFYINVYSLTVACKKKLSFFLCSVKSFPSMYTLLFVTCNFCGPSSFLSHWYIYSLLFPFRLKLLVYKVIGLFQVFARL